MQISKDTIFQLNWQNCKAYYSRRSWQGVGDTGTWARLLGCGLAQPPPRSGWQSLPPNLESCFRSSDPTSRNFSSRNIGPKKWTQRLPQQRRINTAKLWAGRHVHHLRRHRWGRPATRCSPLKDGVIWIPRPSGRVLS